MKRFLKCCVVRETLTKTEQTDAVNYRTLIQEFEKSGKLPSAGGTPLGSFEASSPSELKLDPEESSFSEDKLDRVKKFRARQSEYERKLAEQRELEARKNTPVDPNVPE